MTESPKPFEPLVDNESTVTISLGAGATYDIYHELFKFLSGQLPWQAGDGWNIDLNGEEVNVVSVDDDGMTVRPTLDENWETFGATKSVSWDDVKTIIVF